MSNPYTVRVLLDFDLLVDGRWGHKSLLDLIRDAAYTTFQQYEPYPIKDFSFNAVEASTLDQPT